MHLADLWLREALLAARRGPVVTGGSETRFAAMCTLSWSNFATSCSRPMKLLHYVSQAPHTNICNLIMHKDLQNAAISLNESNSWRRLTTKEHSSVRGFFRAPFTPKIEAHLALAQLTNLPHFSRRLQVRIPVGVVLQCDYIIIIMVHILA